MSRPLIVVLLVIVLELCFPSVALCKEDHQRAHNPHLEVTRPTEPEPAERDPAPKSDVSIPDSGSAGAGAETPSGPPASLPQPSQPDFCQHKDMLRYDFGFGGVTSGQAPMSFHRVVAMRDCHGVMVEHNALQNGATPGGVLWEDQLAYVMGSSDGKTDQYIYAGYTTGYGILSPSYATGGMIAIDHTYAPLDFEFMATASLLPLVERVIWSKQRYAPSWSPLNYETEAGIRLERGHAALRAGYHISKTGDFRRSGFYVGYSLIF